MIVKITKRNGSTSFLTADHFFHNVEEGKDEYIKVKGSKIHVGTDTFFMTKGLRYVTVYDYGEVIWKKLF